MTMMAIMMILTMMMVTMTMTFNDNLDMNRIFESGPVPISVSCLTIGIQYDDPNWNCMLASMKKRLLLAMKNTIKDGGSTASIKGFSKLIY